MIQILLFIFCPIFVFALYQGNPAAPEIPDEGIYSAKESWLAIRVGAEQDFVLDQKMRLTSGALKSKVQSFEESVSLGTAAIVLFRRIQCEGKIGSMQVSISHLAKQATGLKYDSGDHLAYGAGLKALIAYWGESRFGINAQWIRSDLLLDQTYLNEKPISSRAKLLFDTWEVGAGMAYKNDFLTPYFNVYFTQTRAKAHRLMGLEFLFPGGHFKMKNRQHAGLALGCSIAPVKAFAASVEVRVISEQAVSIEGSLQF
jgi:hypothetical protein